MRTIQKMHQDDKDLRCEYIYENFIVKSVDTLVQYEELGKVLNVNLPIDCYTNFRDILFHFRKMMASNDVFEVDKQSTAIKEHASRMLTDASAAILNWLSVVLKLMLSDDVLEEKYAKEMRDKVGILKEILLYKRINGMMLGTVNDTGITHEEILELLYECLEFIQQNCSDWFVQKSKEIVEMDRQVFDNYVSDKC